MMLATRAIRGRAAIAENRSEARKHAELVFSKLQAPSTVRERALDKIDAIRAAEAEKTQILRQARLAKEMLDARSASKLPDTA